MLENKNTSMDSDKISIQPYIVDSAGPSWVLIEYGNGNLDLSELFNIFFKWKNGNDQ